MTPDRSHIIVFDKRTADTVGGDFAVIASVDVDVSQAAPSSARLIPCVTAAGTESIAKRFIQCCDVRLAARGRRVSQIDAADFSLEFASDRAAIPRE